MKILIAEDNPVSRRMLEAQLVCWGHEPAVVADGLAAWKAMDAVDAPRIFILDWMMPGMDGASLCRRFRKAYPKSSAYIILLTALGGHGSMIAGLDAGVDDYITKPYQSDELQARLNAGIRVVELQQSLVDKADELTVALANVQQLQNMLPVCSYCKRVRGDENYWSQLDAYLAENTAVQIQPSVCPDCFKNKLDPQQNPLQRLTPTRPLSRVAAPPAESGREKAS